MQDTSFLTLGKPSKKCSIDLFHEFYVTYEKPKVVELPIGENKKVTQLGFYLQFVPFFFWLSKEYKNLSLPLPMLPSHGLPPS